MRLTRRDLMAGTAAVGATAAASRAIATPRDRPNILWLVSEDNNPFIGAYGDKLARTPAIDALAAKGILYRNAFCTAPVCAPSRYSLITGSPAESNAPANHMRAVAKLPQGWRTTPEFMRAAGYYCTNNSKTDYNCAINPNVVWNESSDKAHWKNRPAGVPFYSMFTYMTTHESQLFGRVEGAVKSQDVAVPPNLPDTPEVRTDIATYYNLIAKMDGQIGAHLAELEQAGLAGDTIVFYFADNGGALPGSKRYGSDKGFRVPLIAYYPPKWAHLAPAKPGSEVTAPVTLMDLCPTIVRLAGQPVPRQMQHGRPLVKGEPAPRYAFGMRNRMDERYDFVRTVTDGRWRYTRNYMRHLPTGQYGAFEWQAKGYQSLETEYRAGRLTPAQARFFQKRPFEELYDLANDPHELTNLAGQRWARAKLRELSAAVDAHMLAVHDNGFIPEGSPLEGYEASGRANAYPLKRVMALGAKAASRDPANLPLFVAGLDDANEVVRYWSAMGLTILGAQAASAAGRLEQRLGAEPSPQVRVSVAQALGAVGRKEAAVPQLVRLLEGSASDRVELQAVNALAYLGASDDQTLAVLRRTQDSKDEYVSRAAKHQVLVLTGEYRPDSPVFGGMEALQRLGHQPR